VGFEPTALATQYSTRYASSQVGGGVVTATNWPTYATVRIWIYRGLFSRTDCRFNV